MGRWRFSYVVLLSIVVTSTQYCLYERDLRYIRNYYYDYGDIWNHRNDMGAWKAKCKNVTLISGEELEYKRQQDQQQPPTSLEISQSSMSELPAGAFAQYSNITVLNISDNHIKDVQIGAFNGLCKLEELYLQTNNLSIIREGVFNALNNLLILDVSFNNIEEAEEHAFTGLKKLRVLILKSNRLTYLSPITFAYQRQLRHLDLSGNNLKVLPEKLFINLTALGTLLLNRTGLNDNSISFVSNLPYSTDLDLSNNFIHSLVDFVNGTRNLKLNKNNVSEINASLPRLAEKIDMGYNGIKQIEINSFAGLKRLRMLNLTHNLIDFISMGSFKDLHLLVILDLSVNNLSKIDFGLLNGLYNLKTLNLGANRIKELSGNIFYEMDLLESIDISENQLQYIAVYNFLEHLKRLKKIAITGNNFECESLVRLVKIFKKGNVQVLKGTVYEKSNVYGIPCKSYNFTVKEADGQGLRNKAVISSQQLGEELKTGPEKDFGTLLKSVIFNLEDIRKETVGLKDIMVLKQANQKRNIDRLPSMQYDYND